MRITSIKVESFGRMKDREFELSPGLNVFYGPNESGKTTLMEFARHVLVPTTKRGQYPERSKKDCGSITYEEGGETREVRLEQNARIGEAPRSLESMDPSIYRSIFAMDATGLNDSDPVSKGEIRSRFLTIPGGDSIPVVIVSIDQDVSDTIGKTNASKSRLNDNSKEQEELYRRIGELREKAESYSQVKDRIGVLEAELAKAEEANREAERSNMQYARIESQRSAFDRLDTLRARRSELSKSQLLERKDIETHDVLVRSASEAKSAFEAIDSSRSELVARLPSRDEQAARRNRSRIRPVLDGRSEYEQRRSRTYSEVRPNTGKRLLPIVGAAAAIAAIMLIPGIDLWIRLISSAAAAVAGVGIMFLTRDKEAPERKANEDWICNYENDVASLSASLGIPDQSISGRLRAISDVESVLNGLDSLKDRWTELYTASMENDMELTIFLTRFRGEEGYRDALLKTSELRSVDDSISILRKSIADSGLDPDRPLPAVSRVETDKHRVSELSSEIGSLKQRCESILDTEELDSLIDRMCVLRQEKLRILREGAVSILSAAIVREACSQQYLNVRPGVMSTADRYLRMMTSDTCSLDTDPRRSELSVISDGMTKNSKQWSTGLRAQIMLSLKLAIAREMGNGDVPVILDDVLLPFDSERKLGACNALSLISEDMQVLLFTCDDRVADACKDLKGALIIPMS